MKRVLSKGIHNTSKKEGRVELSNRHSALKEKVEDENDECKKELEPEYRGETSAFEESRK